jgi:hypothetical protein
MTWTHTSTSTSTSTFWPKDLLPKTCPTARILSFGYKPLFKHFYPLYDPKQVSVETTIDNHSMALLQNLAEYRRATHTVSITWKSMDTERKRGQEARHGNCRVADIYAGRSSNYFRCTQPRWFGMRKRVIPAGRHNLCLRAHRG